MESNTKREQLRKLKIEVCMGIDDPTQTVALEVICNATSKFNPPMSGVPVLVHFFKRMTYGEFQNFTIKGIIVRFADDSDYLCAWVRSKIDYAVRPVDFWSMAVLCKVEQRGDYWYAVGAEESLYHIGSYRDMSEKERTALYHQFRQRGYWDLLLQGLES